MADSRPARPSHRNVARFRQFQQAREFRIPGGGNPAARERDWRTGSGRPWRQVRRVINLRHTRGNRLESTEDFRVHTRGQHTPVSQPIAHVLQEMKTGRRDRSRSPGARRFSRAKLCPRARERRSPNRLGRWQRACCTRYILSRERVVSVTNATLPQRDVPRDCALHRSTRSLVAISRRRARAASPSRALRPLQRSAEPPGSGRDAA